MAGPGAFARKLITGGIAAILSTAARAAPLDCAKLAISVQPEPPGYAAQCLGKTAPAKHPPAAPEANDKVYYVNLRSGVGVTNQKVLQASNPSLNYLVVGPQTLPIFAMDFENTATTLYGIDNASRNLGTINLATGVFTPTTAVTGVVGDTISGMSFDPTSSNVYLSVTNGTPVTSASLYTLNIATGAASFVGPIATQVGAAVPAIVDIAISNTGQMYAHDVGGDRILRIDKATGAAVDVGATGFDANFAQGMDFDADTNRLWLALYQGGGQQSLGSVNLQNGTMKFLQSTSNEELEMAIQNVQPSLKALPVGVIVDPTGNKVLDPNETTTIHPVWQNIGTDPVPAGNGVLQVLTGAPGPTYTIIDPNASYPEIPPGSLATSGDGYTVSVTTTTRPEFHWDSFALESYSDGAPFGNAPAFNFADSPLLHMGETFIDVPISSSPFYRFIEGSLHEGITAGCAPDAYCPDGPISRGQMAVFTIAAKYPGFFPPACAPPNIFGDVPETSPFCRWIENSSVRGIVAGCGGGNFCPDDPVTREQMSVFLLVTRFGRDYQPPACTVPFFTDVNPASPFCRFIERLRQEGFTAGCAPALYCPDQAVTRGQMAAFVLSSLDPDPAFPTPGPTATVTPNVPIRGGMSSGGPDGTRANPVGILLLLVGFASAIGLPFAMRGEPGLRDPNRST
jgi:hypothetical protein